MLERASTCLESTARFSLRCAKRAHKGQRDLHAAFWQPNVNDLDVPLLFFDTSSWSNKAQHKSKNVQSTRRDGTAVQPPSCDEEVGFLDFLYPRQALAGTGQVSAHIEGWEKRNSRQMPSSFVPAARRYSSMSKPSPRTTRTSRPTKMPSFSASNSKRKSDTKGEPGFAEAAVSWPAMEAESILLGFDRLVQKNWKSEMSIEKAEEDGHKRFELGSWSDNLDASDRRAEDLARIDVDTSAAREADANQVTGPNEPAWAVDRQPVFPGTELARAARSATTPYMPDFAKVIATSDAQDPRMQRKAMHARRRARQARMVAYNKVRRAPPLVLQKPRALRKRPPGYRAATGLRVNPYRLTAWTRQRLYRRDLYGAESGAVAQRYARQPSRREMWLSDLRDYKSPVTVKGGRLDGVARLQSVLQQAQKLSAGQSVWTVQSYVKQVWEAWDSLESSAQAQVKLLNDTLGFLATRELPYSDDLVMAVYNSTPVRSAATYGLVIPVFFRCGLIGLAQSAHAEAWAMDEAGHEHTALLTLTAALKAHQWEFAFTLFEQILERRAESRNNTLPSDQIAKALWSELHSIDSLLNQHPSLIQYLASRNNQAPDFSRFKHFALTFLRTAVQHRMDEIRHFIKQALPQIEKADGDDGKQDDDLAVLAEESLTAIQSVYHVESRATADMASTEDAIVAVLNAISHHESKEAAARYAYDMTTQLLNNHDRCNFGKIADLTGRLLRVCAELKDSLEPNQLDRIFRQYQTSLLTFAPSRSREVVSLLNLPPHGLARLWRRTLGFIDRPALVRFLDYHASVGDLESVADFTREYGELLSQVSSETALKDEWSSRDLVATIQVHTARSDALSAYMQFCSLQQEARSRGKDIHTACWNALMRAYVRHEDIAGARQLLEVIASSHKRHMQPSTVLPLLRYHAANGDLLGIEATLKRYVKATSNPPTAPMLRTVVQALISAGSHYDALRLFIQDFAPMMISSADKLQITLMCNSILEGYSPLPTKSILQLRGFMREHKINANPGTLEAFASNLLANNHPDAAHTLITSIDRRFDVDRSISNYGVVMEGFRRAGQPRRVIELYEEIIESGLQPDLQCERLYDGALLTRAQKLPFAEMRARLDERISTLLEQLFLSKLDKIQPVYGHDIGSAESVEQNLAQLGKQARKYLWFDLAYRVVDGYKQRLMEARQRYAAFAAEHDAQPMLRGVLPPQPPLPHMAIVDLELQLAYGEDRFDKVKQAYGVAELLAAKTQSETRQPSRDDTPWPRGLLNGKFGPAMSELSRIIEIESEDRQEPLPTKQPIQKDGILGLRAFAQFKVNIPPRYRTILAEPLLHRLRVAYLRQDHQDFVMVLRDYLSKGYLLDKKAANGILFMCARFRPPLLGLAFWICEKYMLKNWQGWRDNDIIGNVTNARRRELAGLTGIRTQGLAYDEVIPQTKSWLEMLTAYRLFKQALRTKNGQSIKQKSRGGPKRPLHVYGADFGDLGPLIGLRPIDLKSVSSTTLKALQTMPRAIELRALQTQFRRSRAIERHKTMYAPLRRDRVKESRQSRHLREQVEG